MHDDITTSIGRKEIAHIKVEGTVNHLEEQGVESIDKVTFERLSGSTIFD
jgi:hypothetical protein